MAAGSDDITESGLGDFSSFCPAASLPIATRSPRQSANKSSSSRVRAKVAWFTKKTTPEPDSQPEQSYASHSLKRTSSRERDKQPVVSHPLCRNSLPGDLVMQLNEPGLQQPHLDQTHTPRERSDRLSSCPAVEVAELLKRREQAERAHSRPLSQPVDPLKPLRALQDELNALKGCVSQRRVMFSPQRASSPIIHTSTSTDLSIMQEEMADKDVDDYNTTYLSLPSDSIITPLEEFCVQVEPFVNPTKPSPKTRRLCRRGSFEYDHLEDFDPTSRSTEGNSPEVASDAPTADKDAYFVTVQFNTVDHSNGEKITVEDNSAPVCAVEVESHAEQENVHIVIEEEDGQLSSQADEVFHQSSSPPLTPLTKRPLRTLHAGISHSIPGRLNSPSLRLGASQGDKLSKGLWSSASTLPPISDTTCHCPVCCACGSSQRKLTTSASFTHSSVLSGQKDLCSSWPRQRFCPLRQYTTEKPGSGAAGKPSPLPARKPSVHFSPALPMKFQTIPTISQSDNNSSPLVTSHFAWLPSQTACSEDDDTHSLMSVYSHQSASTFTSSGCCDHTHISVNEGVDGSVFKQRMKLLTEWFSEFSDQQRNTLLLRILEQCNCAQMHLLSLQMEPILHQTCPHNCQDLLSWLPLPIVHHILSFLDPESLCRASQVSRSWYAMCSDPWLWKNLALNSKWALSPEGHLKQLELFTQPDNTVQWKKVFADRYRLKRNWLKGFCTVRTFEGHSQGISCVQFDDTRIVSGSWDKTIKVWNRRTNTAWAALTLAGHSGTVRCLHLYNNRLVSGSSDRTIKVWDLATDRVGWVGAACRATMIGHMHTVRCLQTDDRKVVSGSYDHTVKVWDLMTGQCTNTLRGHTDAVLCLQFDNEKIVSGSKDTTIKVWLLSDDQCHLTLHGHQGAVTCLQFDESRVISGALDRLIKIWSITSGECLRTIDWIRSEGHTGVVRHLQADSWKIVSAADDKTLKVWSVLKGERLLTLQSHTDGVTCLQFNDQVIVSGSYDKSVKLWDFSVC